MAIIIPLLLGCVTVNSLLKSFIQPANTMRTNSTASLYSDEKSYYCTHYALHGASVAMACQTPEMIATSVVTGQSYTSTAHITSCDAYDAIFRQYAWDVSVAEAICQAESGGNPYAVSPTNDYGLMQLHNMAIFNPAQNIAAAYQKYQIQGWEAWTTYQTGVYARFQ